MTEKIIDYYSFEVIGSSVCIGSADHPSSDGDSSGAGQTFLTDDIYKVTRISFLMRKVGVIGCKLQAQLYEITGEYGVDSRPTGSPIAVSSIVDVTNWEVSNTWYWKDFMFSLPVIEKDHHYAVIVIVYSNHGDASNIEIANETPESHSGNHCFYNFSAWHGLNEDIAFYVYGILPEEPEPVNIEIEEVDRPWAEIESIDTSDNFDVEIEKV